MNIHLVEDEKFINGAIDLFEKYDPGNNVFVYSSKKDNCTYLKKRKELLYFNYSRIDVLRNFRVLIKKNRIKRIFIHYLTPFKAFISNRLTQEYNLKTYWIFYGADLYNIINRDYGYSLYDNPQLIKKKKLSNSNFLSLSYMKRIVLNRKSDSKEIIRLFKTLNFFCFWNDYDYQLFKKYYETSAEFLRFAYFNVLDYSKELNFSNTQQQRSKILINNSASIYGNHITILEKINKVTESQIGDEVIVPLSYGDESVKKMVIEYGSRKFKNRFFPLTEFIEKDKYYQILNQVKVAFFGSRRQEAAGNIFYLLKIGVKVFLRKDNNMLKFLRDKDFVIFSFEEDFHSIKDLQPLGREQSVQNQVAFQLLFNKNEEIKCMRKLIHS